jgi:hypothetical protein
MSDIQHPQQLSRRLLNEIPVEPESPTDRNAGQLGGISLHELRSNDVSHPNIAFRIPTEKLKFAIVRSAKSYRTGAKLKKGVQRHLELVNIEEMYAVVFAGEDTSRAIALDAQFVRRVYAPCRRLTDLNGCPLIHRCDLHGDP